MTTQRLVCFVWLNSPIPLAKTGDRTAEESLYKASICPVEKKDMHAFVRPVVSVVVLFYYL